MARFKRRTTLPPLRRQGPNRAAVEVGRGSASLARAPEILTNIAIVALVSDFDFEGPRSRKGSSGTADIWKWQRGMMSSRRSAPRAMTAGGHSEVAAEAAPQMGRGCRGRK